MFDPQQDLLWTVCEQAKQVEHLHQQDDYKFLRRPALDKVALRLKHRVGICLIGNTQRDITVGELPCLLQASQGFGHCLDDRSAQSTFLFDCFESPLC